MRLEKAVQFAELALDGRVRPVRGVLPPVLAAKRDGRPAVVVPVANLAEAGLVHGIEVFGAHTLRQIQACLEGKGELERRFKVDVDEGAAVPDLADVVGQQQARFAVEVAAAGAHHLMLSGPPGIGKTMLAQRLPGLLPALTEKESLEVTAIHSVAGLLSAATPLMVPGRSLLAPELEEGQECGHAKEAHNLNVSGENEKVCHEMSGDHGDHECICVGFMSWSGR